mgnify:CR=1 FL=1
MSVKEPFTRFALRFPLTLGAGAVMLLLHDALAGGILGALLPRNASAWELSKLAFFPPLLCLAATSRQSGGVRRVLRRAAPPVLAASLLMAAAGGVAASLTQNTAALMLLWIVLTALCLALAEHWEGGTVWTVLLAALGIAYVLFSFRPPALPPFLEPGDAAAMAPIAW